MFKKLGNYFLVLVVVISLLGCPNNKIKEKPIHRMLFVGNSLTYYNDLPKMVGVIYAALNELEGEHELAIEMLAKGGYSIEQHLNTQVFQKLLKAQNYDYVVLQDFGGWPLCGSQIPACSATAEPLSEAIDLVRASGAIPIWFSTYKRYSNEQIWLSSETSKVASEHSVAIADVGAALHSYSSTNDLADVLGEDFHPNVLGSWVGATAITVAINKGPISDTLSVKPHCRRVWQGNPMYADQVATPQPTHKLDCDLLDFDLWHQVLDAANQTYSAPAIDAALD